MDSTLSKHNIQHVKDSFCWIQSFFYIIPDENIIVNLAEVIGDNATVPSNASDQPEQYFKGSKFRYPDLLVVTKQL